MTESPQDPLLPVIRGVLEREAGVRFGYLFGSAANGRERAGSDVDIAVSLGPEGSPAARLERALRLEGALERALGRPVQVTTLEDAPLELRRNVLGHGILIHVADDPARSRFFVETGRDYYDMASAREIFARYQRRRIREGRFGG